MRYGTQHKQRTRQAILAAAARLFRARGYRAVGVDAVMAEAGLTAGGFYAHFASKDALFAEAMRGLGTSFDELLDNGGLPRLINAYLGRSHRDAPAEGCPLPVLGPECANGSEASRGSFEARLRHFQEALIAALPADDPARPARAIALLAELVGGLMLARAVQDRKYSDAILRACREAARHMSTGAAATGSASRD